MRIRRNAGRLLRSACSVPASPPPDAAAQSELLMPPPPLFMQPYTAAESLAVGDFTSPATASEDACEFSRNPWDLIDELPVCDPQVEDELVDKYFISVPCRATWFVKAGRSVTSAKKAKQNVVDRDRTTSQPRQEAQKKVPKKFAVSKEEGEPKKKATVKKDEARELEQPSYKCKKNDGRQWQCHRLVSRPNSLCDYHFYRRHAHLNPDFAALVEAEAQREMEAEAQMEEVLQRAPASKPATSSKLRKKKPSRDFVATEGFYFYAGFGPCRSKRNCTSNTSMNGYVPDLKKEEEEPAEDGSPTEEKAQAAVDDTIQQAAGRDGKSGGDAVVVGISGIDEESSDDHYELGSYRSSENKVRNFIRRTRKPVKARSLKSLM